MKNFNPSTEKIFLNSLVKDYQDVSRYSQLKKDIILSLIAPHLDKKGRGLQLGCANGYETEKLSEKLNSLVVVDGSSKFIKKVTQQNKFGNVRFVFSLFEEFSIETYRDKFDYIFCNYVLEHVFEPKIIFSNLKSLLKPGGLIFIVVPNSNALSRRIALKMKIVNNLAELTENDHKHGHRRVYDRETIAKETIGAGLKILEIKGIIFKILADFQLNLLLESQFINKNHIEALQKLAEDKNNIELSDSIFLVASG